MQNRRDYSSRYKSETFDSVDNNERGINSGESSGNFSRFDNETHIKKSFTSPSNHNYVFPRFHDNKFISPTGSLKKIVTISRKEPSIYSPSNRFQDFSENENTPTNNDLFSRNSTFREKQQEPLFKTTMVTQVNPPKDDVKAFPSSESQFDPSFIMFSMKQPQQKKSFYEKNKNLVSEIYKAPSMEHAYSTEQSHPPNTQSAYYTFAMPSKQSSDKQFVPSNCKATTNQQPYLRRIIDTSKVPNESPSHNSNNSNLYLKIGEQYYSDNDSSMYYNDKSYTSHPSANTFSNNSTNYVINNKYRKAERCFRNNDGVFENNKSSMYNNNISENNNKHLKNLSKEAEVDALTKLLVENMKMSAEPNFYGMCVKCGRCIMGSSNGCTVLNQTYHTSCFLCKKCVISLAGECFFCLDGECFCESCYLKNLEKCSVCQEPIIDRLLKTMDRCIHAGCLRCGQCGGNLENGAFTMDNDGGIFCLEDYQRKYGMKCESCGLLIAPSPGGHEVSSILFNNHYYHTYCFRCQDCKAELSLSRNGEGCFPLHSAILCNKCFTMHNRNYTDL